MPRRRLPLALTCAAALLFAPPALAGTAEALRALTGARTRVVWVQDTGDGRDTFARGGRLLLRGFDTDDGRGDRVLLEGPRSCAKPLLAPDGRTVVFSDRKAWTVSAVGFDGSGLRTVCDGQALDVWRDPATGTDWVYVGTEAAKGKGDTFAEVRRFRLDRPGQGELVWNRTRVSMDGFRVSADGTRAAGLWPWSAGGVAELPNTRWEKLGGGCWTSLAPDNSTLFWIFDGAHRGVTLTDTMGASWKVQVDTAPGINGYEVYHPTWSNHVRILAVTGPYLGKGGEPGGNRIRDGGKAVEVHVGRFDPQFVSVEKWVRVTENERGDFFPDVWVEGGRATTVAATRRSGLQAVTLSKDALAGFTEWPGHTEGLQFLWQSADATNQIVYPDGTVGRTCVLAERGTARYGRFHDMLLGGGAVLAEAEDAAALLRACRATSQMAVECVLTPATLDQGGPARVVTFSQCASARNWTLGQQGKDLVFRLRTTATDSNGTNPQVTLGPLSAGAPHHVVVSFMPGRLAAFVNGQPVKEAPIGGRLTNWEAMHLLFGDEWDGGRDWAGRLEGVALFNRFVGAEEAALRYRLYKEQHLAGRGPVPRAEVEAEVEVATPTPDPASLDTYRRCLAVHVYRVKKVLAGELAARRIAVARWVILDREVVRKAPRVGQTHRLVLEPWDAHSELESERQVTASREYDLPTYYDPTVP